MTATTSTTTRVHTTTTLINGEGRYLRSELLSATGQWHAGRLQRWWDLHGTLAQQPRVLNLLPGTVANKIVNWNFNIMLLNSSYRNCAAVVVAVAVVVAAAVAAFVVLLLLLLDRRRRRWRRRWWLHPKELASPCNNGRIFRHLS